MSEPDALGVALERSKPDVERRSLGAHYTPAHVADELVAIALDGRAAPRMLDPACGGGAFLLATARALHDRGLTKVEALELLHGVDVDPEAVATTRRALALWSGGEVPADNLVVADALHDGLPWTGFDVVVGNPPFLTPLAAATARTVEQQARLRERFGDAVMAYADASALFLALAVQVARPGGRVVLIQPQSVLGTRDAGGVRAAVTTRGALVDVWFPEARVFDASVNVCAPVIDVESPDEGHGDDAPWSTLLAHQLGVPDPALGRAERTLASLVTPIAGFRDEYYGIAEHVRERDELPDGAPLVTSGLIDLGRCDWGERPARVAKRRWRAPVVDVARVEGKAAAWIARNRTPKIVVATQTRVIEAAVDPSGEWIASVPAVAVPAPAGELWRIAAAVCSPPVTAWLAHHSAGSAITPGALKLSAGVIAKMPLPADEAAWSRGAIALEEGDLDEFGARMTAAYRCDDAVLVWWTSRR